MKLIEKFKPTNAAELPGLVEGRRDVAQWLFLIIHFPF
jgi:hypothetical protein